MFAIADVKKLEENVNTMSLDIVVLMEINNMTIELTKLFCFRCGHKWHPRSEEYPKVCPKCKSPYWDRPRRKKQ